jgi:hypothetical protein
VNAAFLLPRPVDHTGTDASTCPSLGQCHLSATLQLLQEAHAAALEAKACELQAMAAQHAYELDAKRAELEAVVETKVSVSWAGITALACLCIYCFVCKPASTQPSWLASPSWLHGTVRTASSTERAAMSGHAAAWCVPAGGAGG